MRVWCRSMEDGDYASINVATAAAGFRSIGATIEKVPLLRGDDEMITTILFPSSCSGIDKVGEDMNIMNRRNWSHEISMDR